MANVRHGRATPLDVREPARRKVGRPPRLSKEQVVRAALSLADSQGIAAVTMASIAQRVGAQAMSLYRHVRNKEEILDGIVDLVFGEIALPATGTDWKAAMRQRAIALRAALVRHPWAIALMESRIRPGPANLRHHDAVLAALAAGGFAGRLGVRAYNIVNSYVYGFALQELNMPFATRDEHSSVTESILRQFPASDFPHLAQVGVELRRTGFVYAEEFEVGLDLILDGLERLRMASPGPTRSAGARHRAR